MKIICSAFQKDATPHQNAVATRSLIDWGMRNGRDAELVVGSWEGQREVSVQFTRFPDARALFSEAARLCRGFKQTSVFVQVKDTGMLAYPDGTVEAIGTVCLGPMPTRPVHGSANFTEYLTGDVLCVLESTQAERIAA